MKHLAKVGAVLIAIALVLTWQDKAWTSVQFLIAVGIIDIILERKDEQTISQWVHSKFKKAIDVAIMISLVVYMIFRENATIETFNVALIYVIIGHFFNFHLFITRFHCFKLIHSNSKLDDPHINTLPSAKSLRSTLKIE